MSIDPRPLDHLLDECGDYHAHETSEQLARVMYLPYLRNAGTPMSDVPPALRGPNWTPRAWF